MEPKLSSTPFGQRVSLYIHPKLMVYVVDDNNEDNDIVTIDNDNKKQLVFLFFWKSNFIDTSFFLIIDIVCRD